MSSWEPKMCKALDGAIQKTWEPSFKESDYRDIGGTTKAGAVGIYGKVLDEAGNAISGATVYLRSKKFVLASPLNCYKEADTGSQKVGKLPINQYKVLERKENHPNNDTDYLKIDSQAVDGITENEVWIVSRWKDSHYAGETYVKENVSAISGSDGGFYFNVAENIDYKLLCVRNGYYDSRATKNDDSDAIVNTASHCQIIMEAAEGAIDESNIVNNIQYFEGYGYDFDEPRFPPNFNFGYNVEHPADDNDKYNNCTTFSMGLSVKSWMDALGNAFNWNIDYHKKWNIWGAVLTGNTRMKALDGAVTANMGVLFQKVESGGVDAVNGDAVPKPWTLVQGFTKKKTNDAWGAGHSFIILDTFKKSNGDVKVLILESNASETPTDGKKHDPPDGPRIRGIGHIDDLKNSYKNYSPGQAWWMNKDVPTWSSLITKTSYPYRLMVRLKVNNMDWFV